MARMKRGEGVGEAIAIAIRTRNLGASEASPPRKSTQCQPHTHEPRSQGDTAMLPAAERSAQKQCSTCGRRFTRTEHLVRHERTRMNLAHGSIGSLTDDVTDTRDKPFPCSYCDLAFSRNDVLLKHEKNSHVHNANAAPVLKRARAACEDCRRKKIRCISPHQHMQPGNSIGLRDVALAPQQQQTSHSDYDLALSNNAGLSWQQTPGEFDVNAMFVGDASFGVPYDDIDSWNWFDGLPDWVRPFFKSFECDSDMLSEHQLGF